MRRSDPSRNRPMFERCRKTINTPTPAAVAVAAVAMVNNAVANNHQAAGDSASESLAAGLASSALLMAILSASGVLLVGLMRRHKPAPSRPVDRAAAAAITTHTIPIQAAP